MDSLKYFLSKCIGKLLALVLITFKVFCDAFNLKTLRNHKYDADSKEARLFIFSFVIFSIIFAGYNIGYILFYVNKISQIFLITVDMLDYIYCINFICCTVVFMMSYAFSNQSWGDGSKAQMLVHKISTFFWTIGAFCTLLSHFLIPNQ